MDVVDLGVFVRAWEVHTHRLAWLLGAGSSAAAGVPTAHQIVDDLVIRMYASELGIVRQTLDTADPAVLTRINEYFRSNAGLPALGSRDDYSAVLEAALPDESARRSYLRQMLDGRSPSFGQRVVGAFLAAGKTQLVVTTNFDQLIEQAASDAAQHVDGAPLLHVAALGSTDRAVRAVADADWPLLIKLHGDFGESRLKNLNHELQSQDQTLRQAIIDASRQFGLVVGGYSGRDASVMQMLSEAAAQPAAWPNGIWWLLRDVNAVPAEVADFLSAASEAGIGAYLVQTADFGESMAALAAQTSLAPSLRTYVDGLRPRGVLSEAPLPRGDAPAFPVLRMNGLPVLGAPTQLWRVPVPGDVTREVFRSRLREGGWRGAAVLGSGEVLALGRSSTLCQCLHAEGTAEPFDVNMLSSDSSPSVRALALEALARGLARRLPARPIIRERKSWAALAIVPATTDEREPDASTRSKLRSAYDQPLCGILPRSMGTNARGERRGFAEAVRLRWEVAWEQVWLQFLPYTWVEPLAASAGSTRVVDPAASWVRERWTLRRRNNVWAGMVDAWSKALTGDEAHLDVPVLRRDDQAEADALGGEFRLGAKTAWSRQARA